MAETTLEHSDDDPQGEALAEYLCQSLGLVRLQDDSRPKRVFSRFFTKNALGVQKQPCI